MPDSPIDVYFAWLKSLAPEIQAEIIFQVGALLPLCVELDPASDTFAADFETTLREPATAPLYNAGLSLTLATLTDFVFDLKDSEADWAEAERINTAILKKVQERGDVSNLVEHIQRNLTEMPLRAARWIKAADQWKATRARFSLVTVDAWLKPNLGPGAAIT